MPLIAHKDITSRVIGGALALLAAMHVSAAYAQAPSQNNPAVQTFAITGFTVRGDSPIPDAEAQSVLSSYASPKATLDSLQQAVGAFETHLKRQGFNLHRVVLAPQDVGGVITLNVVSFKISKVEVEGNQSYSSANILASIPEMAQGQTPNFVTLAAQTAIANDNKGKQIKVALKEADDADSIEARITVRETKPWGISFSGGNTGSSSTGKDRFTVSGSHHNVLGLDHQATVAVTTSFEGASVKQMGLSYKIPLYRMRSVIAANLTKSDVVGDFGSFRSSGVGQTLGLSYSHYLASKPGIKRFFNVNLDYKEFGATKIDEVLLPGQQARLSRPLTVGYSVNAETDRVNWSFNLGLAGNLPGGTGNNLSAYQSEDPRVQTLAWKALRGDGSILVPIGRGWVGSVRTQFQFSPQVLIAGEQFGVGGSSSVRGTSERPLSGDSGIFISAEAISPPLRPGLNLVGFLDAAAVRNHQPTPNKPASDHLAGLGVGLRFAHKNYSVNLSYARLLQGSMMPPVTGSGIPAKGDSKLHVSVSADF